MSGSRIEKQNLATSSLHPLPRKQQDASRTFLISKNTSWYLLIENKNIALQYHMNAF